MTLGLLNKIVNKVFNIFKRAVFFIFEHALIIFIVKTKYKRLPSSVLGHCNALAGGYFYKIAYKNRNFFDEERRNIDLIRHKYKKIGGIIPDYQYLFFLNNTINLMRTRRLAMICGQTEEFEAAESILNIFREYGVLRPCDERQFFFLSGGLDLVKRFYGEKMYQEVLVSIQLFLKRGPCRIGPCHGDFHHKNVMGLGDKSYVIDFDCFREDGLQALDAIYYVNQYIADNEKISWHVALLRLLSDKKKYSTCHNFLREFLDLEELKGYALIYCLDRFKQDTKFLNGRGIFMGDRFRRSIMYLIDEQRIKK